MKKIKIGILYNEPQPEQYQKKPDIEGTVLHFEPYFEVEHSTPMEAYDLIGEKLRKKGYEVYVLNIKDNLQVLINNLKNEKPDVVFNFIEIFDNKPNYELNIAGLFELMGIAYTGAPPLTLANCQNKYFAKRLLHINVIPTPGFQLIKEEKKEYKIDLHFPLIIKPVLEDASAGIENASVVRDAESLNKRISFVLNDFHQPVLVEEFIEGRELNVSVMGDKNPFALPISEIDFSQMPDHLENIVSYQAKWDPLHESYHKTIPICPAPLKPGIEKKAKEIALKAFKLMEARDYARVDIRLAKNDRLYVLEVNPNPDLTEGAGFMRSAEAAGYKYEDALEQIVRFAFERKN